LLYDLIRKFKVIGSFLDPLTMSFKYFFWDFIEVEMFLHKNDIRNVYSYIQTDVKIILEISRLFL